MNRETTWGLLTEFTQSESLRKHALAVEACMRAYARKYGEDEEKWAITGLIHDFDYEQHPTVEEHPSWAPSCLPNAVIPRKSAAPFSPTPITAECRGKSNMEKALFACDELAGFITAVAMVKPGKSLAEVDAKSVRKKMKDKAFARAVNRDDIVQGAAELGVDLDEHISFCIEAMKSIAAELGLAGQ